MSAADERQAEEYRRKIQAREDNRLVDEQLLATDFGAFKRAWDNTVALLPDPGWIPFRRVVDPNDEDD
jgi:hypothetical protein